MSLTSKTLARSLSLAGSLLLLAMAPPLAAQVDLQSGLQLYYTFDEGMGDQVGDLSGNLRGAQVFAGPQFADKEILWTQGQFGGAVDFDGSYFLSAADYFGIDGKGARTVSLWVNTVNPPSSTTVLVGWGPNQPQQRWHFKFEATSQGIRTENQGGNNFGSIPVVDGTWHHVVSVFPEGGETLESVQHYVDGVLDPVKNGGIANPVNTVADPATGIPVTVGGSPFDAGFRFATTLIDDVRIYNRALSPDEIAALAAGQGVVTGAPPIVTLPRGVDGNPFVDPAPGLAISAVTVVPGAVISNLNMVLNGTDVTAQLTTNISGANATATFAALEPNQSYQVQFKVTDSTGLATLRKISFSTYSESNFIIEAEDYNFEGGQFINDPIPCNVFGGLDQCYFDRISLPGVDAFDSRGFTDDTANFDQVYRYSRGGPDRKEEFDTIRSTDLPRSRNITSGVDDYDVNLLNAGDWANYTRDFPQAEAFQILLRARAAAAQTVRLERVTSSPASPNQTVELLGAFVVPASASYSFIPLTDLAGAKKLTVKLTGNQTLRLSATEANNNLNLNYLMFLPAAKTAILPTVAISEPAAGAVFGTDSPLTIRAAADDEDGFVTKVAFSAVVNGTETLLGTDTEAPFEWAWANPPEGLHTIIARATDDDGLESVSLPVQIIVDSTPPVITAVHESPTLDSIELIFSEPLDQSSAELASHYQISPTLSISSASNSGQRVILATAPQNRGTEYTVTVTGLEDAHGVSQAQGSSKTFTAGNSSLLYGLELYLPFDEGSGNLAADVSGFNRTASVYNDPVFSSINVAWTNGQFSGAVDFNGLYFLGVPGYYGIGGMAPRTVSMWIKTTWVVGGGNVLMGWGRNATGQRWHFKLDNTANGALRTENQGGNNYGSVLVNDGAWHHIVAVFPEGGFVVGDVNHYVDGVLDDIKNGSIATTLDTNIDPLLAPILTVGGGPLGAELRRVTAVLDDVRLYNRALSDAEIVELSQGKGVLAGPAPATPPTLSLQRVPTGEITLTWDRGVLQSTPAIGQNWATVPNASSPHTVTPVGTAFFRVIVP